MCLGVPGQIVDILDANQLLALVDISGVRRSVNLACIADHNSDLNKLVHSWVLIHVGFAMSLIDDDEAKKTLSLLTELGDMQQELDVMQQGEHE